MSAVHIEIMRVFLRLGCTSFGGPMAHIGYLHEEFVRRRAWLDERAFADLVALCQFLPGPASSQLVFALGRQRGGLLGAVLASLCFTLPSVCLMIAFAYGVTRIGDLRHAAWLHGLKLASVAVVAQAVWAMGSKLCTDVARIALALASAVLVLLMPGAWAQVAVIGLGALCGWLLYHREITAQPVEGGLARHHVWAAGTLTLFGVLLLVLPILAATTGAKGVAIFDSFYRSGSLVFGGGHVILPLLRAELVPPGWIGDDAFLAGYGAAQALPGPLFTLAAYLGTLIDGGRYAWLGGLMGVVAVLLPAWLLIGGALPFWHLLRSRPWTQAALRGANAAVVGVLLAALYLPVGREAVGAWRDLWVVFGALGLLQGLRMPSWLVVILCAVVAQWVL